MVIKIIDLTGKSLLEVVNIVKENDLGTGEFTDVTELYEKGSLYADPARFEIYTNGKIKPSDKPHFTDKAKRIICIWLDDRKCQHIKFRMCKNGILVPIRPGSDLHFIEGERHFCWSIMQTLRLVTRNV